MPSDRTYVAEIRESRVALTAVSLLMASVPLIAGIFFRHQILVFLSLLVGSVVASFGVAFLRTRLPVRRRGVVTVGKDVLLLDGRPILEQRNIRGVFPVIGSENSVLLSQVGIRNFRVTTIELASREEANALREDLKWDEAHAAQEFTLVDSSAQRFPWSILVMTTVVMGVLIVANVEFHLDPRFFLPILIASLAVVLVPHFVLMMRNMLTRVRVGTDGLRVKSRGERRFIAYSEIRLITHTETSLTVELISGESITWSHGHGKANVFYDAMRKLNAMSPTVALFERIENARALSSSGAEIRSHLLAALKRDRRSLAEWRHAATALSHEQYRVAATPRDVLENIVLDSAVAPDVRIGAAIALHADAGARVRVATETSALPELGAAIDAALDGDDPALEKAIATLKLTS